MPTIKRIADFRPLLSGPISKVAIDEIVDSVDRHPQDFDTIYNLMNDEELKVSWRATWACEKVAEIHPDWFAGKERELLEKLLASNHDGTKRLLLSILYDIPTEEPFPVDLLDYCFEHMYALNETPGVQSLCLKMAYKLCLKEPELLPEFKMYLENADTDYYSMAVKTCTRNLLKKLR